MKKIRFWLVQSKDRNAKEKNKAEEQMALKIETEKKINTIKLSI